MNHCLPDWNFEPDPPFTNQKKSSGKNNELVELLWRDGHVVMQSQNHRRPELSHLESRPFPPKHETHHHHIPVQQAANAGNTKGSYENSSVLIQDDETVPWIHYPDEDSFEKEFCSHFFTELPAADSLETHKPTILPVHEQSGSKHSLVPDISREMNPVLPPRVQFPDLVPQQKHGPTKVVNFSQFMVPIKSNLKPSNPHFGGAGDVRERSGMTVGLSHCGSNQDVITDSDFSRASSNGTGSVGFCSQLFAEDNVPTMVLQDVGRKTETIEPTITSSSGGSGSSFAGTQKNSMGTSSLKRKGRDVEDSECQSEDAELESGDGKKPSQRSGSTRRSRAAEVHNQSERRRRDRINKKMRALQELIPHCNKTDKASMLDEAIEYLKSLQLQLQMMWMGGGMAAPMMFPGMQPFVSPMGIGMGAHPLAAAVHNNMNMHRVPIVDHHQSMPMAQPNQNVMCQASPVINPMNFQNQMQNQSLPEQFARYMGIQQQLQAAAAAAQPLGMFRFGPQALQNPQVSAVPGAGMVQLGGGASTDDAGKMS